MSSTTTSLLGLYKETPGTQEPADMSKYNANFDTLDNAVTLAGAQTLTNKALTSPVLNGPLTGSGGFNAWTTFTPTMIQGVGITITVTTARYTLLGKLAIVRMYLTISSAGTGGQPIQIASIPAAIAPKDTGVGYCIGSARIALTNNFVAAVIPFTSSTYQFSGYNTTAEFGADPSTGVANTNVISLTAVYEVA